MRVLSAVAGVVLLPALIGGCTPYIPVRDSFGTSAAVPKGDIPPEFAEFNAYDPGVNPLLASQLCATPQQVLQENSVGATPGAMVQGYSRCRTHVPFWGR